MIQPLSVTVRAPGPISPWFLPHISFSSHLCYFSFAVWLLQHQASCRSARQEEGGSCVSPQLCVSFTRIDFPRRPPASHHRRCIYPHCGTWSPPDAVESGKSNAGLSVQFLKDRERKGRKRVGKGVATLSVVEGRTESSTAFTSWIKSISLHLSPRPARKCCGLNLPSAAVALISLSCLVFSSLALVTKQSVAS